MAFAVQRAMICVLQEPHSQYALLTIEARQSAEEIKENGLDYLFGFTGFVHNPHCYTENQLVVSVKENREGILFAAQ